MHSNGLPELSILDISHPREPFGDEVMKAVLQGLYPFRGTFREVVTALHFEATGMGAAAGEVLLDALRDNL